MIKQLKTLTRKEAVEKKLKRYFTGKPCMRNHVAERYTSNGQCITCHTAIGKKFRELNPHKNYRNKEADNLRSRNYWKKNKEAIKIVKKKYREKNAKQMAIKQKIERDKPENKEKKRKYGEGRKAIAAKQRKDRYHKDVEYKLTEIIRLRFRRLVNKGKMRKIKASTLQFAKEVVGISQEGLIKYIEKQFYPHPKTGKKMSWKNHSKTGWHIDHIKPVNSFDLTKLADQKKCFHYTNLQPLWAEENLSKSDKYL